MTEPERRAAELRTLLAWLGHQRQVVERIDQRLDRVEVRAAGGGDPDLVAATTLYLQQYYTGIEGALLRVAEDLDGSVPSGEEWHRYLLEQIALDIPQVRPALLTPVLRGHLDALRRFRHRVHHAYDQDYDWSRMAEPLQARTQATVLLPAFFAETGAVIGEIIHALEEATG
ncbi:MAG: hypothetical protein AB1505_05720 [Candidatus Latescibacterota bacterium]